MTFEMPETTAEELRATQLSCLRDSLSLAYERVPHYRKAFDTAGVRP